MRCVGATGPTSVAASRWWTTAFARRTVVSARAGIAAPVSAITAPIRSSRRTRAARERPERPSMFPPWAKILRGKTERSMPPNIWCARATTWRNGLTNQSAQFTVEANRVPFADLDDLVVDLDPRGAAHDDVDLLLGHVLVAEGNAEARGEGQQAQPERRAADRSPGESRLELRGHPELRRLVLDL